MSHEQTTTEQQQQQQNELTTRIPDPEMVPRAKRRQFTAEYKLRIRQEADACAEPGEIGALLRREGLYSSYLSAWRRQREERQLQALSSKKRGRKSQDPSLAELAQLQRENERLPTRAKQGSEPNHLTLHADRGSAMTSKTVVLLLADLGVSKTHFRPYVRTMSTLPRRSAPTGMRTPWLTSKPLLRLTCRVRSLFSVSNCRCRSLVFHFYTGHVHRAPHLLLATVIPDQHREQFPPIQTPRLGAPDPSVDRLSRGRFCQARWV